MNIYSPLLHKKCEHPGRCCTLRSARGYALLVLASCCWIGEWYKIWVHPLCANLEGCNCLPHPSVILSLTFVGETFLWSTIAPTLRGQQIGVSSTRAQPHHSRPRVGGSNSVATQQQLRGTTRMSSFVVCLACVLSCLGSSLHVTSCRFLGLLIWLCFVSLSADVLGEQKPPRFLLVSARVHPRSR